MKTIKKIIDIYLWVWSKMAPGYDEEGDWRGGVIAFSFPFWCLWMIIAHLIRRLFLVEIHISILVILTVLQTIALYFYYRKDKKGQAIINCYNLSKLNKRYIVCCIGVIYYLLLAMFLFVSLSLINYYFGC